MRAGTDSPATTQVPTAATPEPRPGRRFSRRLFGYRASSVDEAMETLEQRVEALERHEANLREELLSAQHAASEARHDLTRSRAELRYWNDRATYVDTEIARARNRATELEQTARERAQSIEADAQERSLQLIDRVCAEANAMLQHAREEARDMFLRFETDVDMKQQKLEQLEQVRRDVATSMQSALATFEDAVRELDRVAPAKRLVEVLEEPERRSVPTFGKQRALEAARRFEGGTDRSAAAALSTPIADAPTVTPSTADADAPANEVQTEPLAPGHSVFAASIDPETTVEPAPKDTTYEVRPQLGDIAPSSPVRLPVHDADDDFAALLMQP